MNLYSQLLDLGVEPSFIDAIVFAGGTPAAPSAPSATSGPSVSSSGIAKLPSTPGQPRMPKIIAPKIPKPVVAPKLPKAAAPHVAIHVHAPGQKAQAPIAPVVPPVAKNQPQNAQGGQTVAKASQVAPVAKQSKSWSDTNNPWTKRGDIPPAGRTNWAMEQAKQKFNTMSGKNPAKFQKYATKFGDQFRFMALMTGLAGKFVSANPIPPPTQDEITRLAQVLRMTPQQLVSGGWNGQPLR